MSKIRIIPTVLYKDNVAVRGKKFDNWRVSGSLLQTIRLYSLREVDELICTYDPNSKGGKSPDGRKVRGTIHWVSKSESIKSEVRIYNPLFLTEKPDESTNFLLDINPNSIEVLNDCYIEPNLSKAKPGDIFQFERLGYFCIDSKDSKATDLVFNRSVPLKDSWSKINQLK